MIEGGVLFAAGLAFTWFLWGAVRAFRRVRGVRVVTCPDDSAPAAVRLDAARAALTATFGSVVRVRVCSRWTRRPGCSQACLGPLLSSPGTGAVDDLLAAWYAGRRCALCGSPFEDLRWAARPPCLLSADGGTVEWQAVPPERLPAALAASRPACYTCHVVNSLRRERPDLMVGPATEPEREAHGAR